MADKGQKPAETGSSIEARLVLKPLAELETNQNNPRNIDGEQMELLINSLLVFPKMMKARPIVIAEGNIVQGGNMRTLALNSISTMSQSDIKQHLASCSDYNKMTPELQKECINYWKAWQKDPVVPVYDANDFTPEEIRQFIIKDNASFGSWDWDALANGWDEAELKSWGLTVWQPEESTAQPEEEDTSAEDDFNIDDDGITVRVKPGEVWQLGDHRLMCGDSTKVEDVRKLMGGGRVFLRFVAD